MKTLAVVLLVVALGWNAFGIYEVVKEELAREKREGNEHE